MIADLPGKARSDTIDRLARLIGFPTITRQSNLALIDAVRTELASHGIASRLVHDESGTKANLWASVGPADRPGILLSGHSDVVPVEGQAWTVPPFTMTPQGDRLLGRGTADMKGFLACAIGAMIDASRRPLVRPLQLAISYDEEIGCVGVRRLIDVLAAAPNRPSLCVIGEPTAMQVGCGHKGKAALRALCCGLEGHSALAPSGLNAIHLATDLIQTLRSIQREFATGGARDADYDVPYTTVHVGVIAGGKALNIVPNACTVDFEIRHLPTDDPDQVLARVRAAADAIVRRERAGVVPATDAGAIEIETVNAYPGLETHPASASVRFVESLLPAGTARLKVAYGTEGGLFANRLDVPVVVVGPGSITQAHKPDEFIEQGQLAQCEAFLQALVGTLVR